ncbi:MAG TPA: hypothetical protein VH062_01960 [Polyangiaceae bacterium]|nr:hypothetical protein [Polyangiaceae bacterium]
MIASVCQRWRDRAGSYRPAGEPIRTSAYDVAEITTDREARAFVERHHYSGSYPAALRRFGLYRGAELVGVAVLSQPASQAALDAALPFADDGRAELGRFVLLDEVPANGESWFLARCFELARREGFVAIVAHSDPEPRRAAGAVVFVGHIGTIYQATNATYVGRTARRTRRMFADGTVLSDAALSKLRSRRKGWRYATELLMAHGAPPPARELMPGADWRAWVREAVDATTTAFRHGGNHRYVWALDRRLRRALPASMAYPKWESAVAA